MGTTLCVLTLLHVLVIFSILCCKQDNVNVVVVDWSAGGNTWNYYKAAVNTRIVGYQISKCVHDNVT